MLVGRSVGPSVRRSVGPSPLAFFGVYGQFLRHCSCPPARDFGTRVYGPQTFLFSNSSFNGEKFSGFILSHKMTKHAILFHLVPISTSIPPPFNQKMIFTFRFIHPMRILVFTLVTAVFREKFHAWYQTKGKDMVYHQRRAHAWVAEQSRKNHLI